MSISSRDKEGFASSSTKDTDTEAQKSPEPQSPSPMELVTAIPQEHCDRGREDVIPMEEPFRQEASNGEYMYLVDSEVETRVRWPHPREAGDEERPEDLPRNPRGGGHDERPRICPGTPEREDTKIGRRIVPAPQEKGRSTPRLKELVPTLTGTQPSRRRKWGGLSAEGARN